MLAVPRLCASKGHHMMFHSLLGFYWFNFDASKHTCHGQWYSGWVIKKLKQNFKCQFHVSALLLARFMLAIPQNPALCAYHLHYSHSICIGYASAQQSIITVSNHVIILYYQQQSVAIRITDTVAVDQYMIVKITICYFILVLDTAHYYLLLRIGTCYCWFPLDDMQVDR